MRIFTSRLKVSLEELLLVSGIGAEEVRQFAGLPEPGGPGPSATEARDPGFRVQLDFDASFNSHKTSLLGLSPQVFAALPPGAAQAPRPKRYRYAVVGLKDDKMGELIPLGSGVEVDVMQNAVKVSDWKNMRERPVYLVWHTEGHSCCCCHLEGKELTLLPYLFQAGSTPAER